MRTCRLKYQEVGVGADFLNFVYFYQGVNLPNIQKREYTQCLHKNAT